MYIFTGTYPVYYHELRIHSIQIGCYELATYQQNRAKEYACPDTQLEEEHEKLV